MAVRLRFEAGLPWQDAAIEAVSGLFAPGGLPPEGELLQRVRAAQARSALPLSDEVPSPEFSVEMETGTGKTYVFLRTALTLAERCGLRKFVIVVPGLAIREGVLSSIELLREHLARLHGPDPIWARAYHSGRLADLRDWAQSPDRAFLILNIEAIHRDTNLIHRLHDGFFGQRPIDLVRGARPVVIVDEPQRIDSPRARAALAALGPLATLRYSATHRDPRQLVFKLGPAEAARRGLVKSVDVAGATDPREQVRQTVRTHLEKERWIQARGERMKVLSLSFLDRVADYEPDDAPVRRWFEEAWEAERVSGRWGELPEARRVHGGYFAQKKGRAADTSGRSAADARACRLILKGRTELLDPEEPLRFLFSHSALREGWDNPNVFQLCVLNRGKSTIRRRQEIGRGLRLPVRADGTRSRDPEVARLTIVAQGAYAAFAEALQAEYSADGQSAPSLRDRGALEQGRLRAGWAEDPAFVALWSVVGRSGRFAVDVDVDALVVEARAALTAPTGSSKAQDLVGRLVQETALSRALVLAILRPWSGLDAALADPEGFLEAALPALQGVLRSHLGARTRVHAGEALPSDTIAAQLPSGYGADVLPTDLCPWTLLAPRSARERTRLRSWLDDPQTRCVLPLPPLKTPGGSWPGGWARLAKGAEVWSPSGADAFAAAWFRAAGAEFTCP